MESAPTPETRVEFAVQMSCGSCVDAISKKSSKLWLIRPIVKGLGKPTRVVKGCVLDWHARYFRFLKVFRFKRWVKHEPPNELGCRFVAQSFERWRVNSPAVSLEWHTAIRFKLISTCLSCSRLNWLLEKCVLGDDNLDEPARTKDMPKRDESFSKKSSILLACVAGLQVSYLTWGVLQEKIMTQDYQDPNTGSVGRFKDSQFLVFVNRILAFLISGAYLLVTSQPRHRTPLYQYSFCSLSNTLSSWCQYEALKFVSFPTQVLAKACKVIPVLLMGKFISKTSYPTYEYVCAVLISVGMSAFLLGSADETHIRDKVTTLSGVVLLCGYLLFDSFTANWQGAVFKKYKPSSVQMMCGVNFVSCLLTSVSLIQQGGFFYSIHFAFQYPLFIWDCLITALTSATGQLFIFYTIAKFGPVIFTIIMTVRQGLSVLLSCIVYNHPLAPVGAVGVAIVFFAIFLRTYAANRATKLRSAANANGLQKL
nr:EOG090X05CU [Triops cancriformis]